jgi:hypothetical protein
MIAIKSINVSSLFSTNFLYISFSIDNTDEDLANYQFILYKSNSPNFGYILCKSDIKSFYYADDDVDLHDLTIEYYYKIEVINKITFERKMSDIYGKYRSVEPDNIASTIAYTYKQYLYNTVNNPEMYLLTRKRFGQVCSCYDDIRGRSEPRGCTLCYGTSFTGGYFDPYKIKVCLLNTSVKTEDFSVSADSETESPIQLWTLNYPPIYPDDILIDKDNNRFIVMNSVPSVKNYFILRQIITVQKMPKSNVIYKFPLNI